jgi:N-acetylglutamate synthase-like GNAT family acetyltransferase
MSISLHKNPVIRPARAEERYELIELQRRASLMHEAYRDALIAHPEAVDLPAAQIRDGSVLVAELDARLAGFVAVLANGTEAEIDGLFVEPDVWRRGIGRQLMAAGETAVRRLGITRLSVIAAPEAEAFYAACGFITTGPEQTPFGPAIRMRKTLI